MVNMKNRLLIIQTIGIFLGFLIGVYIMSHDWIAAAVSGLLVNIVLIIIYVFTGRLLISGWKT